MMMKLIIEILMLIVLCFIAIMLYVDLTENQKTQKDIGIINKNITYIAE